MSNKHTPGPWQVEGLKISYARDVYALYTGTEVKPHWLADIQFMNKHFDEGEANARLIAAAPDMLDMLRKCRSLLLSREIESIGLDDLLNRIDNG